MPEPLLWRAELWRLNPPKLLVSGRVTYPRQTSRWKRPRPSPPESSWNGGWRCAPSTQHSTAAPFHWLGPDISKFHISHLVVLHHHSAVPSLCCQFIQSTEVIWSGNSYSWVKSSRRPSRPSNTGHHDVEMDVSWTPGFKSAASELVWDLNSIVNETCFWKRNVRVVGTFFLRRNISRCFRKVLLAMNPIISKKGSGKTALEIVPRHPVTPPQKMSFGTPKTHLKHPKTPNLKRYNWMSREGD